MIYKVNWKSGVMKGPHTFKIIWLTATDVILRSSCADSDFQHGVTSSVQEENGEGGAIINRYHICILCYHNEDHLAHYLPPLLYNKILRPVFSVSSVNVPSETDGRGRIRGYGHCSAEVATTRFTRNGSEAS